MFRLLSRVGGVISIVLFAILLMAVLLNAFNPFRLAEDRMTAVISSDPAFEARLAYYGQTSSQWHENLRPFVFLAEPIAGIIDELKAWQQWDHVLELAKNVEGGQLLLVSTDKIAHAIVEFDGTLEKASASSLVSDQLVVLSRDGGYLTPSQLREIYQSDQVSISGLGELNAIVRDLATTLRGFYGAIGLEETITSLATKGEYPFLELVGLKDDLYQALVGWQAMPGTLDLIHDQIASDIRSLQRINRWYSFAANVEGALNAVYLRQGSRWIVAQLRPLLVVFFVCLGVWVLSSLANTKLVRRLVRRIKWPGPAWRKQYRPGMVLTTRFANTTDQPRLVHQEEPESEARLAEKVNSPASLPVRLPDPKYGPFIPPQPRHGDPTQAVMVCNWENGEYKKGPMPIHLTLGASHKDDLVSDHTRSRKSQAVIKRARTTYYLEVLDRHHPTYINGEVVTGSPKLEVGDMVTVGDLTVVVMY